MQRSWYGIGKQPSLGITFGFTKLIGQKIQFDARSTLHGAKVGTCPFGVTLLVGHSTVYCLVCFTPSLSTSDRSDLIQRATKLGEENAEAVFVSTNPQIISPYCRWSCRWRPRTPDQPAGSTRETCLARLCRKNIPITTGLLTSLICRLFVRVAALASTYKVVLEISTQNQSQLRFATWARFECSYVVPTVCCAGLTRPRSRFAGSNN